VTLDFDAGKYAVYVWPGYALTILVFAGLIADSLARARRWKRSVLAREQSAGEAEAER
jgi:heme exporter protein D